MVIPVNFEHMWSRASAQGPRSAASGPDRRWDQTAVLYAARGLGDYWDYSAPGRMVIAEDGSNTWLDEAEGPHVYLIEKMPPERVAAEIEALMATPPMAVTAGQP